MSIQVVPAIIPSSFHDLENRIREVKDFAETVQIDVMDGVHVTEKSWPNTVPEDPDFERVKTQGEGMPYWENVQFEIDLMVKNPENVWRDWILAGASRIIVHLESTENLGQILEDFKKENVSKDSFLYSQIGVALQIETQNEKLYPYLEDVDFVQFMGIEKIGYQGEEFDERVLEKIKSLKKRNPDTIISVDGAMNEKTIPLVHEAGAERVAVGSALFESENIKETYKHLSSL